MLGQDVFDLVVEAYRRGGPLGQRVPARSFLDVLPRAAVEQQLGDLLDNGTLLPGPDGTVGLAPRVRGALLSRTVLHGWWNAAAQAVPATQEVLQAAMRAELREVAACCLRAPEETGLHRRAIELLAVLAMADLDPRAVDVVAGLPGTVQMQLEDLSAIPAGSCRTLRELQSRVRRFVTTRTPAPAV